MAPDPAHVAAALERVEARLARIESVLGLEGSKKPSGPAAVERPDPPVQSPRKTEEDLEFRIGQEWFARVGIAALGLGVAFTLSLPYPSLPAWAPSLLGYLLTLGLFAAAGFCPGSLTLVASYLRAIAMALGYFSSMRLCFFGATHALGADSTGAALVLTAAAGANVGIAWWRRSAWLFGLALVTAACTALAVASAGLGFLLIALLSLAAAAAGISLRRPAPILVAMPLAYFAYLSLALDNPFLGRSVEVIPGPVWVPAVLLVCIVAFARGLRLSTQGHWERTLANAGILLNVLAGYTLYVLHTLGCHEARFVDYQLAASVLLLGLGFVHACEKDAVGSFICAMTAFLALSSAIIKATQPPDVFVWLSLQSVIVVATAIWLRSRFMIVANFVIYLAILACYVAVARQERGISLGFGLVALGTARLLGWKQERLELKTELMRNAYLVAAFFIFPYALYHLVPAAWVGLAWVGAALLYYGLAASLRNRKYRWMGHATLLLTAVYLAVAGLSRLEPLLRNVSFLVLGAVLLIVSLVFTRLRARRP